MKCIKSIKDWGAARILLVLTAAQFLLGALYGWFFWGEMKDVNAAGWIFIFSGPIYLVLALSARWLKTFSLLTGFILYLVFVITVHPEPSDAGAWQDGLFLKVPILSFLLWGLLQQGERPGHNLNALSTAILLVGSGFGIQFSITRMIRLREWNSQMQDSLTFFVQHVPKKESVIGFVDLFGKMHSRLFNGLALISFILGACSFAFCWAMAGLAARRIKARGQRVVDA